MTNDTSQAGHVDLMKVPDYVHRLKPYAPGKPIEELEREYGISGSIKLASNENPIGPSPKALEAIMGALKNLHRYPDGSNYYLTKRLAEKMVPSGLRTDWRLASCPTRRSPSLL